MLLTLFGTPFFVTLAFAGLVHVAHHRHVLRELLLASHQRVSRAVLCTVGTGVSAGSC